LEIFITFLTNIYEGFPLEETFFSRYVLQQIHSYKETESSEIIRRHLMELTDLCQKQKGKR